jgi:zona occludens toxin (predicted ATPase)
MKTLKLVAALAGTAVALSSSIASASSENRAAAACAKAFAAQLAVPGGAAPPYKLDFQPFEESSIVSGFYATHYTFDLSARDPRSNASIARATCVTSRSGTIDSLTSLPPATAGTELASTL